MAPNSDTTDLSSLLFARAALSLSRTQRLISSWLPPPSEAEAKIARASLDLKNEEGGVFAPSSELAGLGAKSTEEGETASKFLASDEKLKIQFLGRDWVKRHESKGAWGRKATSSRLRSKPKPTVALRQDATVDSSEDEGGRSSLLGKTRSRKMTDWQEDNHEEAEVREGTGDRAIAVRMSRPQKPFEKSTTYLDEVLAKKAQKQQGKRRKTHLQVSAAKDSNSPNGS